MFYRGTSFLDILRQAEERFDSLELGMSIEPGDVHDVEESVLK